MVTVLNIPYYLISMDFWCYCCCCCCCADVSDQSKLLYLTIQSLCCFVFNYFLRTAERIFHRVCVSYKLEQNVCVLPLLLACFVALWLPYKYFLFSLCLFFFKKQMSTNFRSIFAFVRLNDYYFPLFFFISVISCFDNRSCVTCLLPFVCISVYLCVLTRIVLPFPSLLMRVFVYAFMWVCEYLFLNLMHFAVTCKNVCVRV